MLFTSPTKGKLNLEQMVEDIFAYLLEDDQAKYCLVIGSDSQERFTDKKKMANFITAVVVHRVGKGGRYFWRNGTKVEVHSIRDKVYRETSLSLDLASQLVPLLNKALASQKNWQLEIHIDVGPTGKTRDMIKEVVGMVTGSGYIARTKPDSFAASSIADKHT